MTNRILIPASAAAAHIGISPQTLGRYIKEGWLGGYYATPVKLPRFYVDRLDDLREAVRARKGRWRTRAVSA